MHGLLDTGSNISACDTVAFQFFKSLHLKSCKCKRFLVTAANGATETVYELIYACVEFNGQTKVIEIYHIPGLSQHLVLGMSFWHAFDFTLLQNNNIHRFSQVASSTFNINSLSNEKLTASQQSELDSVIQLFRSLDNGTLGKTNVMTHTIETGDATPIYQRPYPVSPAILDRIKREIARMVSLGVIEKSSSPWANPIVLVKKKNGKDRLCLDSRKLNSVTKHDRYPLPHINSILSRLGQAKYLSSIDLQDAFWQIPLDEASKEKTAFNIAGLGTFVFNVVPFGTKTAAQAMQRLMDTIFAEDGFAYLDDYLIPSSTFEEHMQMLRAAAQKLKDANLSINFNKCQFCKPSLKYLGFIIDGDGLRTDTEKLECIMNYPRPKTVTEMRRFLGFASWYRRFVSNFAALSAPLHNLTKSLSKHKQLVWTAPALKAFQDLKSALVSPPVLITPDFSKQFTIHCDASKTALGAVLTQKDDKDPNMDRPIAYISRKLRGAEINYSVTELECLAVVFAVEKFRPYVEGFQFNVITDHSALIWLFKQPNLTGRLARWLMKLQQFDINISHIKGRHNVIPDTLSRIPADPVNIDIIQIDNVIVDPWYEKLKSKIISSPNRHKHYKIVDGKVFIKLKSNTPQIINQPWKLVVPPSSRNLVLNECHDSPTAAHLGIRKTKLKILDRYFWPGLAIDVMKHVKSCQTCIESKPSTKKKYGLMGLMKTVSRPWQLISIDLMGPFTRSSKGNSYILVICDYFTKFPIIVPIRVATAAKICDILENSVFLEHGIPETIVMDNGKQFVSHKFKDLLNKYGVSNFFYNCLYHPQNNPVERQNKIIISAVRSYIGDNQKNWDVHIPKITVALRTAVNAVTGHSPFYLTYGREYIYAGSDHIFYSISQNNSVDPISDRTQFLDSFKSILNDITKRMIKSYETNKKYYDRNRTHYSFEVGDIVYRRNFTLSDASKAYSAKLAKLYIKCKVIEKISDIVYVLKEEESGKKGRYHIQDIKPI